MTEQVLMPTDMKILVVETQYPGCWGKGDTLDQALAKAGNPKKYKAYIVHPDSYVVDGPRIQISFPQPFAPKEIHSQPRSRKLSPA